MSQSVMGPHTTVSRENSAPRSASMVVQKKTEVPGTEFFLCFIDIYLTEVPLNGPANASMDDLEKWTIPLLNEFLNNVNYEETIMEVGEKFSNGTIAKFVEIILNQ